MTTPEPAHENSFQAHLRSCRYWESREGRPPVPEEDIRAEYDLVAHRAHLRAEAIAKRIALDDAGKAAERVGDVGGSNLQVVRHIHHHGPSLPRPPAVKVSRSEPGAIRLPE